MNVMTVGFQEVSKKIDIVRFVVIVNRYFYSATVDPILKADMFVGEPGIGKTRVEDDGRTMILPVDINSPKVYACKNEIGGLTFMLAEEY